MIRITRVYDQRGDDAALHVLVDRLWPRGVRKDDDRIDEWWKELAPSAALRNWYGHQEDRFAEFVERYTDELAAEELQPLLDRARQAAAGPGLVLLTSTKALDLSHTRVLAKVIDQPASQSRR
jgi:uncharacterized protein YeaO (DUF488 family)